MPALSVDGKEGLMQSPAFPAPSYLASGAASLCDYP